ncbi:MAG TPA: hypothetical protein VEX39_02720 [Thermoleophilaceae bacterium]|nr:hypothetical protein [Thermoleophilaceae bacterium]
MAGSSKAAVATALRLAKNEKVVHAFKHAATSKAAQEAAGGAGLSVGRSFLEGRSSRRKTKRADAENRAKAIRYAQQHQGQYSERIIIDQEYHYVVWREGLAVATFPPIDAALTPELLQQRFELQHVPDALRQAPPSAGEQ